MGTDDPNPPLACLTGQIVAHLFQRKAGLLGDLVGRAEFFEERRESRLELSRLDFVPDQVFAGPNGVGDRRIGDAIQNDSLRKRHLDDGAGEYAAPAGDQPVLACVG